MAIVHVPESAWAKEAIKWEAEGSIMGPGLRPYVKRDWPSWVYKAGQLPAGGLDIVDTRQIDQHEYDRLHANGYRLTPLEALEALNGQQLEFAKLSAEREWEKTHGRLSPRAIEEVRAVEDDAGAQHLPTIPETPHGLRGVHVTSDREMELQQAVRIEAEQRTLLQAELEALKAQLAQATAPKKRGRKPKAKPVDA